MKIRNHRKKEWIFYPSKNSKLGVRSFKKKSSLMKFLNSDIDNTINGAITIHENSFNRSGAIRQYLVWYNAHEYGIKKTNTIKIVLKQLDFRGKKFISSKNWRKIEKSSKRYFAFSDKVVNLMCNIADSGIDENKATNLVNLFYKRGFKDFEPDDEALRYINGHISDGIDFHHWSDRCNFLRAKTIIEYFKREELIN